MREEIKIWWEQAKRDFDTAKFLYNGKKYEESALFSQQTIEKSLKALLLKKEKIIKTHDLLFLAEKVKLPENLKENCKELSLIYVHARYPDTGEIKDKKNKAKIYLSYVDKVLKWIEKQL